MRAFVQSIYNVCVGLCLDSLFSFLVTAAFALEQNCIFPWKCPFPFSTNFTNLSAESEDPRYGYNVGCNLVYQFPTSQFADAKYYGDPTWHHGKGAAAKLERQVRSNYPIIRVPSITPTATWRVCFGCQTISKDSKDQRSIAVVGYVRSFHIWGIVSLGLATPSHTRNTPKSASFWSESQFGAVAPLRRAPEVCGRAAWWCMPGWTNRQRWLPPAWCFTQYIQKCH